MKVGTLSQIWVYPVKSAAGISLDSSKVALRGLEYDRRWMVIDENRRLVTQRERPELALLRTSFTGECLRLEADGMLGLELPLYPDALHPDDSELLTVMMWKEPMTAHLVEAATDWFSTLLGGLYRLVYMPETTLRPSPDHAPSPVSFADGNPFLLVSEASLADLNGRLDNPVDVRHFRPNLVVSGCEAFAEDGWDAVKIGALRLRCTIPCVRCMLVNVDPDKGERRTEPLRTLARYRRVGKQVRFGQNFRYADESYPSLTCGDPVTLEEPDGAA